MFTTRRCTWGASVLATIMLANPAAAASWVAIPIAPTSVQIMIQMTDGTLLVQGYNGQTWMKYAPDANGNYATGTWTTLAPGIIPRIYYASQVLPDGRFWMAGGEYTGPGLQANWGASAEIYDPIANTWSVAAPMPPQSGCPT